MLSYVELCRVMGCVWACMFFYFYIIENDSFHPVYLFLYSKILPSVRVMKKKGRKEIYRQQVKYKKYKEKELSKKSDDRKLVGGGGVTYSTVHNVRSFYIY